MSLFPMEWQLPNDPGLLPRAPSPPFTQSNPSFSALEEGTDGHTPRHGYKRNLSQTLAHSVENISSPNTGKVHCNPSDVSLAPAQKARVKKKAKPSHYRREKQQGDLPPPPLPPPSEDSAFPGTAAPCPDYGISPLERDTNGTTSAERRAGHRTALDQHNHLHRDEEEIIPYSKPTFLSRSQVSSNCSTTGSSSSKGSTGSRGHGWSRTAGDRSEEKR
ncbi:roundabout-like protein 2 isoform B [Alligator mississippiensis]|uniref:Roundabout-like protein 2 isoform B n=1 Tax=Alligator mississippiensis TaxID=8496 RepID=A0A151NGD3_ALLMI|nr:roundabout-like protein 2 isoform B [Alligator mississippiensis]